MKTLKKTSTCKGHNSAELTTPFPLKFHCTMSEKIDTLIFNQDLFDFPDIQMIRSLPYWFDIILAPSGVWSGVRYGRGRTSLLGRQMRISLIQTRCYRGLDFLQWLAQTAKYTLLGTLMYWLLGFSAQLFLVDSSVVRCSICPTVPRTYCRGGSVQPFTMTTIC